MNCVDCVHYFLKIEDHKMQVVHLHVDQFLVVSYKIFIKEDQIWPAYDKVGIGRMPKQVREERTQFGLPLWIFSQSTCLYLPKLIRRPKVADREIPSVSSLFHSRKDFLRKMRKRDDPFDIGFGKPDIIHVSTFHRPVNVSMPPSMNFSANSLASLIVCLSVESLCLALVLSVYLK